MIAALLVFVLVAGFIIGGFFAALHVSRLLAQQRLERRLQEVGPVQDATEATLVREERPGPLPAVDRLIGDTAAGPRLARFLQQAGSSLTPGALVLLTLVTALAAGFAAHLFVPNLLIALAVGALGAALPAVLLMRQRSTRLKRFEEQFPDALDLLSRAIRAGHAFQASMGMVATELPAPVGPEFKQTFEQQNFGLPLRDSLFQLADRLPLMDVRFFTTAVLIQRDTGGNLAEILDNLAHVVRERFRIRRDIRTKTAHGRFTGLVLLGLPAGLGVILAMINPDHMDLLFTHRIGQMLIGIAIVMQTVGFFWIRRILDLEV